MIVKAQNGITRNIYQLQMQGNQLFGILKEDDRAIFLGKYDSIERTSEVMAECTCTNWNDNKASYSMPLV